MIKIKFYKNKQEDKPKKRVSKLFINFSIVTSVLFYPLSFVYAALSCTVTTQASCNGSGYTTLLRLSGSTNAHAELPSQSNANYASNVVCCSGIASLGNSCSGNYQNFAKLSAVTNAHVQETSVNTYGTNACISDSVGNSTITVGYQNTNCTGYDTTLFSISASDNATSGDGSAYTRKVCATVVQPTITFDIDTATDFHNGESGTPYSVELGTITPSAVVHSDDTSIKMIVLEGETNASGGMIITVMNANGTNGLVSSSVPTDNINSSTASMAIGTENYGLCVATVGLSGFSRSSPYDTGTCALNSGTNAVKALSSSGTNILDSGGTAVSGGHAEIVVNAEVSNTTASHNDYADTLTFIATGTF